MSPCRDTAHREASVHAPLVGLREAVDEVLGRDDLVRIDGVADDVRAASDDVFHALVKRGRRAGP